VGENFLYWLNSKSKGNRTEQVTFSERNRDTDMIVSYTSAESIKSREIRSNREKDGGVKNQWRRRDLRYYLVYFCCRERYEIFLSLLKEESNERNEWKDMSYYHCWRKEGYESFLFLSKPWKDMRDPLSLLKEWRVWEFTIISEWFFYWSKATIIFHI
jgi:hypothetical protein